MELFKLFGTILVDNDKANKSIHQTESKASVAFAKIGKGIQNLAKVGFVGATAFATGVGLLTKSAIENYGEYEQLVGGIDTLFKDSNKKVMEYASNAYKTAGMTANKYMETVTSFSASLLSALGGDTAKASEIANMAITDMSDNANKMGTSMELIQNAYQGFAKGNYGMLDNLKLGFGGTKSEMERLLVEAENKMGTSMELIQNAYQGFAKGNYGMLDNLKLGFGGTKSEMERLLVEAEKLSGIKYDISNLNDVFEAIHVIQTEMGITGTTAKEASSTLQGSFQMMKSAWDNLVTGMADPKQDLGVLIGNVVDSGVTVLNNLIPRIAETVPRIITGLGTVIGTIGAQLPSLLSTLLPVVINAGKQIASGLFNSITSVFDNIGEITAKASAFMSYIGEGIKEKIPEVISNALPMLLGFSEAILANAPILIESGMNLIADIIQGLVNSLPDLIAYVPEIITNIANTFSMGMQIIITKGAEIVWSIITGIVSAIPDLIANIGDIVGAIFAVWQAIQWWDLGTNLVNNIWTGITSLWESFKTYIDDIFNGIFNSVSSTFTNIATNSSGIWNGIFNTVKGVANNLWTSLKTTFTNLLGNVKTIFNDIKNGITNPIEYAKDFVKKMIDKIVSFFKFEWSLPRLKLPHVNITGGFSLFPPSVPKFSVDWYAKGGIMNDPSFFKFEWSLPRLKLPHVNITGGFSLFPPSVPKFSVDWYAKGGIMNDPTAFGINPNNGKVMVGGEKGAEAIAPIDTLLGYVRTAVNESNSGLAEALQNIILLLSDYMPQLANMQLVLDSGVLVGEIAPQVDEELGDIQRRKGRN